MSAHALSEFGAPLEPNAAPRREREATSRSARIISTVNGRNGSNIAVPPYQELIETEYVRPAAVHWMGEARTLDTAEASQEFDDEEILQPRRLLLRVF